MDSLGSVKNFIIIVEGDSVRWNIRRLVFS